MLSNFDPLLEELSTLASDIHKMVPTGPGPNLGRKTTSSRLSYFMNKRHGNNDFAIELISDESSGRSIISALKVNDQILSFAEARSLANQKEFQKTNLAKIIKALDLGRDLKSKDSSGEKIGSKLYVSGNEVKMRGLLKSSYHKVASLNNSESYKQAALTKLRELNNSINFYNITFDSLEEAQANILDVIIKIERCNFDNILGSNSEYQNIKDELSQKSLILNNLISEMHLINEQAANSIKIEPINFHFLTEKAPNTVEQIDDLINQLRSSNSTIDLSNLNKLLESPLIPQQTATQINSHYSNVKSNFENLPTKNILIKGLNLIKFATVNKAQSNISLENIKAFSTAFITFQEELANFLSENQLSAKDNAIFNLVSAEISQNLSEYADIYYDKMLELDLSTKNSLNSSLYDERDFLRHITSSIPEFNKVRSINSNLIHFAEKTTLTGPNQIAAINKDIKLNILKHYEQGSLVNSGINDIEGDENLQSNAFYSEQLLAKFARIIPNNASGQKDIRAANTIYNACFSGDYKMITLAANSLHDPNDRSSSFLDNFTYQMAVNGIEIAADESKHDLLKEKVKIEHQLRLAKRDLSDSLGVNCLDSIKLSQSIKALKSTELDSNNNNIDLIFLMSAISEIRLDCYNELEAANNLTDENLNNLFTEKTETFLNELQLEGFSMANSDKYLELGFDLKQLDQANLLTSLVNQGFSNSEEVTKTLRKISVFAKQASKDTTLHNNLLQNFMQEDFTLLSHEIQSNVLNKIFGINHAEQSMVGTIIDHSGEKMDEVFHQADSGAQIARRSKTVRGVKIGRFLSNLGGNRVATQDPAGNIHTIEKVEDILSILNNNQTSINNLESAIGEISETDLLAKDEAELSEEEKQLKNHIDFEDQLLDIAGANFKESFYLIHFALLYGFDQEKQQNKQLNFNDYLHNIIENQPSHIDSGKTARQVISEKLHIPDSLHTLLDIEIRKLTHMNKEQIQNYMLDWYNDIKIDEKQQQLSQEIDTISGKVGQTNKFSGLGGMLDEMSASDSISITTEGELNLSSATEIAGAAQNALTEGALSVNASITAKKQDHFKIEKTDNGYAVIFNQEKGAELGLGFSTALGLIEAMGNIGGSLSSGYRVNFNDKDELIRFTSRIFNDPKLVVGDLAKAESILLMNGRSLKHSKDISIGIPSIVNSIDTTLGLSHDSQYEDARNNAISIASGQFRIGFEDAVTKEITTETNRNTKVTNQSYQKTFDFQGFGKTEDILAAIGVNTNDLHFHYISSAKTTETHGFITDHKIREEITLTSEEANISQGQKAMAALDQLMRGQHEKILFEEDEEFKEDFEQAVNELQEENPTIVVERELQPEALQALASFAQKAFSENSHEDAKKLYEKQAEQTLKDAKNTRIKKVMVKSNIKNASQKAFKTVSVSRQKSREVKLNRNRLLAQQANATTRVGASR